MKNQWFKVPIRRSTVLLFWVTVIAVFLLIYFFAPSLFNQMRQVTYQNTPYVNTPIQP